MSLYYKKKHVVLLTDCFGDIQAGAEKQIFELAKGLNKNNYRVTIASLETIGKAPRELVESAGCELQLFPVRRIYGISGFSQGIKFLKFLKEQKVDILQTYHFSSDIWGPFLAHLAGVKVIISNRRDMGFWRSAHHIRAYDWVNQWVTRIVVNAQSIRNYVKNTEDMPRRNIEVIYNGVDLPTHHVASASSGQLDIKPGSLVIMHVANFKPVKGHKYLLKALKGIIEKHPEAQLVLIGEDTMAGEIQRLAGQLKILDHVLFLGKRPDVRNLLPLADICVLPSLSEGLSNAILEYMAAGKPVVATNVGGTPELIEHNVHGLLVEKEKSTPLKEALIKLIEDKHLREKMGAAGRQKALDQFFMPGMVNRYEQFYSSLLPREVKVMHFISSGGLFGAENVLLNLAANMDKEIYHPIVAAIQDGRKANLQVAERARELKIPVKVFQSKGKIDFDTVNKLKRCLTAHKIDVLHTHNYKSDIIGALATRHLNVKLIATAHGFTDINHKVSVYEKIDRMFLKKFFDGVVVVSDSVMPDFPQKMVIQNGIDVKRFQQTQKSRMEIRRQYGIQDDEIVIGTVARLSIEKNQKLLIAAADKVCKRNSKVKIMIVGDGPEEDLLKNAVKNLQLEKQIIFTGLMRNVAPFYKAFDIFTLTSLTEGVPMTVLEAMASGVTVVATRVGGIPQIISHGLSGLLVNSNDLDGLVSAFEKLVADESLRKKLANAGFCFVQQEYSIEQMTRLYSQVYQKALVQ